MANTNSSTTLSIVDTFKAFSRAADLPSIVTIFRNLVSLCHTDGKETYSSIKNSLPVGENQFEIFKILDQKIKLPEFSEKSGVPEEIVIIGGGPAGLRFAIESRLVLGPLTRITVLEKRTTFSRNNVLHLWPSTCSDLLLLGTKCFFPKFCTGGLNHISIKRLQQVLLKISLLLGVEFCEGTLFTSAIPPSEQTSFKWTINAQNLSNGSSIQFPCSVLIGADGAKSIVASTFGFERKEFKAGLAIGITANFVNSNKKHDLAEEFSFLSCMKPEFFREIQEKTGMELENMVYFRDETHYIVFTAKKHSLVSRGVLKSDSLLLQRENIDREHLLKVAQDVAAVAKIPCDSFYIDEATGKEDVEIFDFTKKTMATQCVKMFEDLDTGNRLLVGLLGDALLEPHWPQGTGGNRAILGALDTASMLPAFFRMKHRTEEDPEQLLLGREAVYKAMQNCSASKIKKDHRKHNTRPESRYLKIEPLISMPPNITLRHYCLPKTVQ